MLEKGRGLGEASRGSACDGSRELQLCKLSFILDSPEVTDGSNV